MFSRAHEIAASNRMLKFYDVSADDVEHVMTIAGYVRVSRNRETNAVAVESRDLRNGDWHPCDDWSILTAIPVWPIAGLPGESAARVSDLLSTAIFSVVREDEFALAAENGGRGVDEKELIQAKSWFKSQLFGMHPLVARKKRVAQPRSGLIGHQVYNALKGVRKAFHTTFKEKEVFSAALAISPLSLTLAEYLHLALSREGLLKVWRERRNLVPMLPHISRKRWSDDDLFSTATWVKPGKPTQVLDLSVDVADRAFPRRKAVGADLMSFRAKPGFRWLSKARNTVVRRWIDEGKSAEAASFMASLNLPKETPVYVVGAALREFCRTRIQLLHSMGGEGVSPGDVRVLRLYRAYARHWTSVREEIGHKAMILEMMDTSPMTFVLDWLSSEGFRAGMPDSNSSWASLVDRSTEWHAVRAPGRMAPADFDDHPDETPIEFAHGTKMVDGFLITPLDTVGAMRDEGGDMNHCIASYASTSVAGHYRAFRIEGRGERATMGFYVIGGAARFDQVKAFGNGSVSPELRKAALAVCDAYGAGESGAKEAA